jgi:uncharacterized membrane-anchored protein YjiN (DUF445 family)
MSEQTESYIVLKPIAERFNRIASELTDDDIKSIIKSEIRDQIKKVNFTMSVETIIEEYIDENKDQIISMYVNSLEDRLSK